MIPPIPRRQPQSTPTSPQFEPLLDSAEAAALLQIHPKTLQKLARGRNGNRDPCRQALAVPSLYSERMAGQDGGLIEWRREIISGSTPS
jgi:hypothetical protein